MSRLNDYLDDRLDADERARFEDQLAGDEELAQQLAAALAIRNELRGGVEDLPETFYTRTVARFSARRRRLPLGLSWSTAGLAVATLAAAAIFVPFVLREEPPGMPKSPQALEESTGLVKEAAPEKGGRGAGDAVSSLESLGYVGDEQAAAEQSKDDAVARDSVEAVDGFDDRKRQAVNEPAPLTEQERWASTKSKPAATPPPAIAQQPERRIQAVEPEPVPVEVRESLSKLGTETEFEEGQSSGKGRATEADPSDKLELNARLERAQKEDAGELDKMWDADAPAETGYLNYNGPLPKAVELEVDLAGAGEIELLDSRDPALQIATGSKKESRARSDLELKSTAVAASRFVAIGRRPGLDACAALTVRRTTEAWEISYEDSGSSVGAVSCGIELPADGVKIRFQGWPVGE